MGTYIMSEDTFNGQPIWDKVDSDGKRFAFYNGYSWTISKFKYRDDVIHDRMNEKGVRGIISSTNKNEVFAETIWNGAMINY